MQIIDTRFQIFIGCKSQGRRNTPFFIIPFQFIAELWRNRSRIIQRRKVYSERILVISQMNVTDISKGIFQRWIRFIGRYRYTVQLQFGESNGRNTLHAFHLRRVNDSQSLIGSHNNPAIPQSQRTAFAIYIAQHIAGEEVVLKSLWARKKAGNSIFGSNPYFTFRIFYKSLYHTVH